MALNRFIGMGRFVRDPEMRRTQAGTAITKFCLAVERDFKDKQTGKREADFINFVAWDKKAEHVARYFSKGDMAVVEGRLTIRNWTDNDGNKHVITEVIVSDVYFGGAKKQKSDDVAAGESQDWVEMDGGDDDGNLPF